jgi:hypothetical protein
MGFLNSTVLDLAIGLAFVFLLLAIICTATNEWIAGIFSLRAKTLGRAITQMLDGQNNGSGKALLADFYAHPLIAGMMVPGKDSPSGHPSYLPSRTFATAVMDLVTPGSPGAITFADLENGITGLPDGDVKTALLALIQNAQGDLDKAQKCIEHWFDDTMQRASGWYKRHLQVVTLCTAIVLTVVTNADTIQIGHVLWTSPTERALLVSKAQRRVTAASTQTQIEYPDKNKPLEPKQKLKPDELETLQAVLGWSGQQPSDLTGWLSRTGGWLISVIAISLGAPFWFDLLSKLMNVRSAGQKPKASANT